MQNANWADELELDVTFNHPEFIRLLANEEKNGFVVLAILI